jgi:hypothetical protein
MTESERLDKIAKLEYRVRDLEGRLASPSPSRRGGPYTFLALELVKIRKEIERLKGILPTPAKK